MPARLLLVLAALAVAGLAWLVFGGALGGEDGELGSREFGFEDPEAAMRDADGLGLEADGRPRRKGRDAAGQDPAAKPGATRPARALPMSKRVAVVRGVVRDAQGRPVANARGWLRGPHGERIEFTTDAKGRFEVSTRPGRHQVFVEGAGLVGFVADAVVTGSADQELEVDVVPAQPLTVTVLDEGEPLPAAAVRAQLLPAGTGLVQEQATATNGVARFDTLPAGTYELAVTVPDGPTLREEVTLSSEAPTAARIEVPPLVLLRGTVKVAGEGPPVADAELELHVKTTDSEHPVVTIWRSGADGAFEVAVPRGQPRGIQVRAAGYAPWPARGDLARVLGSLHGLRTKEPVHLDVSIAAGWSLGGRMTNAADEQPVAGIVLRAVAFGGADRPGGIVAHAVSDEDGRYEFTNLAAASYALEIETAGWFPKRGQGMHVSVGATDGVQEHLHDIALTASRVLEGVVRARVSGEEQPPLEGVRVWVVGGGVAAHAARNAGRALETWTDAQGAWRIDDLPTGVNVVLRAAIGTWEAQPLPIAWNRPPAGLLELVLGATGRLAGRVVEAGTETPVAGATVRLVPVPYDGRTVVQIESDEAGRLAHEGLIPGRWSLRAKADGFLDGAPVEVVVGTTEPAAPTVGLDPGVVFAGEVVDAAGSPLEDVTILARGRPASGGSYTARSVRSAADGTFRLSGLPPGVYTVTASRAGYRSHVEPGLGGTHANLRFILARP